MHGGDSDRTFQTGNVGATGRSPFSLRRFGGSQDRDVFEENFRVYDHSLRPYATNEMLELPIQELGKNDANVLKINPERFVDHSILKELESTGSLTAWQRSTDSSDLARSLDRG